MRQLFQIFSVLALLALPLAAFAGNVSITEIMYDLDGADIDWVEVKNIGSDDLDLSSLKLLVSNSTSNHGVVPYTGAGTLAPNDYGVIIATSSIANFIAKWGSAMKLFTASFSLPNAGGTVSLNEGDKSVPLDSVTYASSQGASADGNSLQKSSTGDFVAASPTPGAGASGQGAAPPAPSATTTGGTSNWPVEPQLIASAGPDRVAASGADVVFEGKAYGLKKEPIDDARFVWNFGDGAVKEGKNVAHAYAYPGDYVVILDVASGYFSGSDRARVRVEDSKLFISSIGGGRFIELTNPSNEELDLSHWFLRAGTSTFEIPSRTFIAGNRTLAFAGAVTGLSPSAVMPPELLYPNGAVAARYSGEKTEETKSPLPVRVRAQTGNSPAAATVTTKASVPPTLAPAKVQEAAVAKALPEEPSMPAAYWWLIGTVALALVGAAGVSFGRFPKKGGLQPEDFTIIEEK